MKKYIIHVYFILLFNREDLSVFSSPKLNDKWCS